MRERLVSRLTVLVDDKSLSSSVSPIVKLESNFSSPPVCIIIRLMADTGGGAWLHGAQLREDQAVENE